MTFPYHDDNWTEPADFLHRHVEKEESILAPDLFWWRFDSIFRYRNTFSDPSRDYDFALIHKDEIAWIEPQVLSRTMARGHCVFANSVFVIWSARTDLRPVPARSDHVRAFHERLSALTEDERSRAGISALGDDTVLPDPGAITKFETLDATALKVALNRFWENGGYLYTTLRDKTYYAEIDRHIAYFAAGLRSLRILDLACGIGRLPNFITGANSVFGIDISEVAVRRARQTCPTAAYAVMDAQHLGFADASFSRVLFIDAIEHVKDAPATLSEIARVLKPSGDLVATVANRNSLHLFIARKLGVPEFKTNYQHIREFTLDEIRLLFAEHGLSVVESKGNFLYPFWGVPLLDDAVRTITDGDPETVELFRLLGERVGAEYAYSFTVRAVKDL
jgi:SAM-dependent methyltransferase